MTVKTYDGAMAEVIDEYLDKSRRPKYIFSMHYNLMSGNQSKIVPLENYGYELVMVKDLEVYETRKEVKKDLSKLTLMGKNEEIEKLEKGAIDYYNKKK